MACIKTVLFCSEKDYETELNLLCCDLFCFFIVDDRGLRNVARLVNNVRYLDVLFFARLRRM